MEHFITPNLLHLRKQRGMTQVLFAEEIGVTRSTLGAYEEYRVTPPVKVLIRIAQHFGLTLDQLVLTPLSQ